jgi:hypothetical protein
MDSIAGDGDMIDQVKIYKIINLTLVEIECFYI